MMTPSHDFGEYRGGKFLTTDVALVIAVGEPCRDFSQVITSEAIRAETVVAESAVPDEPTIDLRVRHPFGRTGHSGPGTPRRFRRYQLRGIARRRVRAGPAARHPRPHQQT